MDELIVISRVVHFSAVAILFGGSLFWTFLAPAGTDTRCRWWPAAVDIVAVVATLLSALGWLIGVAASMAGGWSDILEADVLAAVTIDTRFGRVWLPRLAITVALLALLPVMRTMSKPRGIVVLVVSGVLAASLAGVGHGPAGPGRTGLLHLVSDVVHVLCATAWIGALAGLAVLLRRSLTDRREARSAVIRDAVWRFSRFGYAVVGLLLVTGSVNAAVLIATPQSMVATDYGRTLLVKLGFVVVMLIIAARNRFSIAARLERKDGGVEGSVIVPLYRSVLVELVIGFMVLAAVALLGTIHPV